MEIIAYDWKEDRSNNQFIHYLKIDGKKEKLTLYVTDEAKKPDGWIKSGLTFPLHYSEETTESFMRLLIPLIGANKYKLEDNGHEQIAWFSGFSRG